MNVGRKPGLTRRNMLAASAAVAFPGISVATTWPARPIRWIVPYAAGGPGDAFSRPVALQLSEVLKQPVVVENLGGAGGNVGSKRIALSEPDGYTIGLASTGSHSINPVIYPKMPFDPIKDFTPLTLACRYANQLIVRNDSPVRSVADLIEYAKSHPTSYGSAGVGASNHLSGEILSNVAKVPMLHVPYRGNAPALAGLLSGDITFMFDMPTNAQSLVNAGRVRQLAVTTAQRWPYLPHVPTMAEAGVQGYTDAGTDLWFAVVAPARLPRDVVEKLHAALLASLRSTNVRQSASEQQFEIWTSTPQELANEIRVGIERWGRIARAANIKL